MVRAVPLRAESGFTLIEVLVASIVLVTGLLGTFALVDRANSTTFTTRAREGAVALGRQVLDSAHGVSYTKLNDQRLSGALQQLPGLGDSQLQDGRYTIVRRGVVYTVTTSVCSYDDAADSTGPHGSGQFCADSPGGGSGASGTLDFGGTTADGSVAVGGGSPDDYKRVVATVSWTRGGAHAVRGATIVDNPGTSGGPGITAFATANTSITNPATTSVTFSATTSDAPATMNWAVDGTAQGTPTGAGTSWSFAWPIDSLVDGDYMVSTQAFDTAGLSGSPRSMTVTLNRYAPQAPTGLDGGRNGGTVDLEWLQNPERDISGYRVYRTSGSGTSLVCPASGTTPVQGTSCQDMSPPGDATLTYVVKAVDKDSSGAYREGAPSAQVRVTKTNNPPNPPTSLLASSSGGTTILRWTAPAIPDPDPGDSIAFYRIYRDGVSYLDRYDRTGLGTDLSYTDRSPGGSTHTYYVTAMDTHYAESTALGPVTK